MATNNVNFKVKNGVNVGANLIFDGTSARIQGDFSNSTLTNRTLVQTSTANASSYFSTIPNGTGVTSGFFAYNNSDPTNAGWAQIAINTGQMFVGSGISGSGTYVPLTFWTGGSERMRIDANGKVGIGTTVPGGKLDIVDSTVAVSTINAVLAKGPTDTNFTILVKNGVSGAADGTVQASLGMDYSTTHTDLAGIKFLRTGGAGGHIAFYTGNAANGTERMRIDNAGRVRVGLYTTDLTNGTPGVYGFSRIMGMGQHSTDVGQVSAANFDALAVVPSWQSLNMYSHGASASGNLTYNPSLVAANAAELIAINKAHLSISTNTGPIAFATNGVERMRIGATGDIQMKHNGASTYGSVLQLETTGGTDDPALTFKNYNGGTPSYVGIACTDAGGLSVRTGASTTSWGTERAIIDGNGIYTPNYMRASGLSTVWGTTNGQLTGAFNASMGTGSSATWLLSGTSGSTFRCGIQALDSNGQLRLYSNGNYVAINGASIIATSSVTGGDFTTYRTGAETTGYIYFGNTGTKYCGFDGTNFVSTMPMSFNINGSSSSCTGNAATATSAVIQSGIGGTTTNWNTHFTETGASQRSWTESSTNGPTGSWWFIENMRHSNAGGYWGRQHAWGWEDNGNEFYTRNVSNNVWGSWVRFLNSSNYSSYALPLSGGTISGNIIMAPAGTTRGYVYADGAGIGFLTSGGAWALRVDYGTANVQALADFTAAGNVTAYSDPRLKENFKVIDKPLDIVNAIQGGTFTWKEGIEHTKVKAGKKDYGILADQVEAVMPEIVMTSTVIEGQSYKTVAYDKLVPVLLEAIKELEARIKVLESQNK